MRRFILEEIHKDRIGEIVDKDLIKKSVMQFIYMGYEKSQINRSPETNEIVWTANEKNLAKYDQDFEAFLQSSTREFYRKSAGEWKNTFSCHEYIKKVSAHLTLEENNADRFLQE